MKHGLTKHSQSIIFSRLQLRHVDRNFSTEHLTSLLVLWLNSKQKLIIQFKYHY